MVDSGHGLTDGLTDWRTVRKLYASLWGGGIKTTDFLTKYLTDNYKIAGEKGRTYLQTLQSEKLAKEKDVTSRNIERPNEEYIYKD